MYKAIEKETITENTTLSDLKFEILSLSYLNQLRTLIWNQIERIRLMNDF